MEISAVPACSNPGFLCRWLACRRSRRGPSLVQPAGKRSACSSSTMECPALYLSFGVLESHKQDQDFQSAFPGRALSGMRMFYPTPGVQFTIFEGSEHQGLFFNQNAARSQFKGLRWAGQPVKCSTWQNRRFTGRSSSRADKNRWRSLAVR